MTTEEAERILKGDPSGLEFMIDEVYELCQFVTDICLFYDHGRPELVKWAEAFVYLVEHDEYYFKEIKK